MNEHSMMGPPDPRALGSDEPPYSLEVKDGEAIEGETIPRRNAKYGQCSHLRSLISDDIATVYDLVEWTANRYANKIAISVKQDGLAAFKLRTDRFNNGRGTSSYVNLTYEQYSEIVLELGSGLSHLGLGKGDKILIHGSTSVQWLALSHGASSQSIAFVTAYESLGYSGLVTSLKMTRVKAIYVDQNLFPLIVEALGQEDLSNVESVVYNPQPPSSSVRSNNDNTQWNVSLQTAKESFSHIRFLSLIELRQLGQFHMIAPTRPDREDLAAIYYTSGSTGSPKGVPIKHKAIIASVTGLDSVIGDYLGPEDMFLAYLPLAHVLEYAFENSCFFWGTRIGYGSPKTLFDAVGTAGNVMGDFSIFQPTFLIGVPAIWERIKKRIIADVNTRSFLPRSIFWSSARFKSWGLGVRYPVAENTINAAFAPARKLLGSRLRFAMSGGGPLAETTQHFLSTVLAPLINGYGLTETMAMGGLMDPLELQPGSLGRIPMCIEVKLIDYPEAGYFVTNTPPQGELLIRGDSVFEGYLEDKVASKEVLTSDGWFRTGDIGQLESNGEFRLIDRKKNLVKTLNGEYIALEKLESVYRTDQLVSNVCVYASPLHSRPLAFVIPSHAELRGLAFHCGVDVTPDITPLLRNEEILRAALERLQTLATSVGLAKIEIIAQLVFVEDDDWTPANGLTTAVGKLNRRAILERHRNYIIR